MTASWWDRLLELLAPAPAPPAPAPVVAPVPGELAIPSIPKEVSTMRRPGLMLELLRALGVGQAEKWAPLLEQGAERWDITTPRRLAAWVATLVHESAKFTRRTESLHYTTAGRLCEVWPSRFPTIASAAPYLRNAPKLAEFVYGGRMGNVPGTGDALHFVGRGLTGVTGRSNYEEMAEACGKLLEEMAAWMETPEGAAATGAAWWGVNGLNRIADTGDIVAVRKKVNGGKIGLKDVEQLYAKALAVIGPE